MPNEVKQLENGQLEVKLESGEVFTGDALSVTNKMAEAHVNTKRWGQGLKQELETLKATPPVPVTPPPAVDPNEAQLQGYLLDQTAKALGFKSADEYKTKLGRYEDLAEQYHDQSIAQQFLNSCPDFPNTQEAIDRLGAFLDQNKWEFSVPNMIAGHSMAVRQGLYKPLTQDEINMSLNSAAKANENGPPAPPVVTPNSPDAHAPNPNDLYAMKQDELREKMLGAFRAENPSSR